MASWPNSTDASLEVASDSFSWSLQALHCFEQKNQALVDYTKIIAWALIFVIPPYLMAGDQQSLTKVSPNFLVAVFFAAYFLYVLVQVDHYAALGLRVIPIILLPAAAVAANPRDWLGCCAHPAAMLTLSILTTSSRTLALSLFRLADSPKVPGFRLGQGANIHVDLTKTGPASHHSTELSGPAMTLTDEDITERPPREDMNGDGPVVAWRDANYFSHHRL